MGPAPGMLVATFTLASTFASLVSDDARASGQGPPPSSSLGSPLDALTRPSDAVSGRVSSNNPDPWSNSDNRWVKPGETLTIADLKGPGVIRHIWFTFAEAAPSWLSNQGAADPSEIVLRIYWDNADRPAVECPLGDFFAAGFGKRAEIQSVPVMVQGGDSYNCFWPMPYHSAARITLENQGSRPLAALYYQIDYTSEPSLPKDALYFCASYRQEFPARAGTDYVIADITGRGHYVGTVMSVRSRSPEWFGEGDDKFYIDGAQTPTMTGTGTEDYFLNAWGMEKGCYPYNGVTILDGWLGDLGNTGTMYRWHVLDAVHFQKSLRVAIEHAGWMSADETASGKIEGFVEREDDFATVAFWYQEGYPRPFEALPTAAQRKLPSIDDIIEAKELLARARSTDASLVLQEGPPWTGSGQLFAAAERSNYTIETTFTIAPEARPFRPYLVFTRAPDYGTLRITLDGSPIPAEFDGFAKSIDLQEVVLSTTPLAPGEHTLRLECTGKNLQSSGYKAGLDSIRLRHRTAVKRIPMHAPKP